MARYGIIHFLRYRQDVPLGHGVGPAFLYTSFKRIGIYQLNLLTGTRSNQCCLFMFHRNILWVESINGNAAACHRYALWVDL
jgi:hypothetical protein